MEQKVKKHSLLSNAIYAFKPAVRTDPVYLADIVIHAVLSVLLPLIASGCSSLIIGLLENGLSLPVIVISILTVFTIYGGMSWLHTYLSTVSGYAYSNIRLKGHMLNLARQDMQLSLEQFESDEIRQKAEKASMATYSNRDGLEGTMRNCGALLANVLGLITYSLIVGGLNLGILALLLALSAVTTLASGLSVRIYRKIEDGLAQQNRVTQYIDKVTDSATGGKDIRIFGLSPWLIGKYDRAIAAGRKLRFSYDASCYMADAVESVLSAVRSLVCYLYLIAQLKNGMSAAEFVFYLGLISGFASWFSEISRLLVDMKRTSGQVDNYRDFLEQESTMEDKGKLPAGGFAQIEVVFDHVSYRYEGAEQFVLRDVSFTLKKGEHLALVGLNGAGKSTLVKLMSGLYLPTEGAVLINGVDTRILNRTAYMKHIAAIFQTPFILSYSIGENVALAEEYEPEKVCAALRGAGLYEKIASLPEGIRTYLGKDISEDGISLSGGETQKLLLARALYRDPALILLDEPTAALDALAENTIYETYNTSLTHKTVLFISHRLASTRFCRNILLLEQGELREQGTHEELMRKNGIYANLFHVQSRYYQDKD